jgi:hypothetical protein
MTDNKKLRPPSEWSGTKTVPMHSQEGIQMLWELTMELSNRLTKLEKMNILNYCPETRNVNAIKACPTCGKHHD